MDLKILYRQRIHGRDAPVVVQWTVSGAAAVPRVGERVQIARGIGAWVKTVSWLRMFDVAEVELKDEGPVVAEHWNLETQPYGWYVVKPEPGPWIDQEIDLTPPPRRQIPIPPP